MACLTSNTLKQGHGFSITLSKYSSSLNTLKFHCLSHIFIAVSPPKHAPFLVVRAQYVRNTLHAKLSATDHESSTETMNFRTKKENGSGCSSLRRIDKVVERQNVKNVCSSVVEEKTGKQFTNDRNATKDKALKERKGMTSRNYTMRSKDGNSGMKSLEIANGTRVVNGEMERKNKKGGHNQVKEEKTEKGSKKDKGDSSELDFRVSFDMCSKRGDVMGVIQLYDLAQREGIKMGQYHYSVLLYLCSSAAVGVVQPAKSGRENYSRAVNSLAMSDEQSSVELGYKGDRKSGANELDIRVSNSRLKLVNARGEPGSTDKMESNYSGRFDDVDRNFSGNESLAQLSARKENNEIQVTEDVKKYALQRGFEIFEQMCLDKVPINEATLTAVARMAMSMGNGDLAFDIVKQMKPLGINPRLRSYGPALSLFCNSGDVDKAFAVEKHMLEHCVYPEEPELEALLKASAEAGKGDQVYYMLHKLRTSARKVSPCAAGIIARWFNSKAASRVGKAKWDHRLIKEAIANRGGGWHGQGWLGKGKWAVSYTSVGPDGFCKCCGEKLVTIDLDPTETENFAESVASIAIKRDRDSSFQRFQKWLDYYGPFEAVVDGANVGIFYQGRFIPSKINAVVNGIRQKLPSKKWPLIVLHNRRITGRKMDEPVNKSLIEKWKNADALYATPTGSNDDWYWLYAAIKFKCLIVTNDEMRDHTFQLLGNDFFPRWKERHQVHFRFTDAGPVFDMPPSCSVVIQESEEGYWHIPIATECEYEAEREWLCITRGNSHRKRLHSITATLEGSQSVDGQARSTLQTGVAINPEILIHNDHDSVRNSPKEAYKNLRNILSASGFTDHRTVLSEIEEAEKLGDCVIDFQI